MQTIEIQKGVLVGFEEMITGASKLDTPDLEFFLEKLGQLLARRKNPRPNERELDLINTIYQCLTITNQARYNELAEKLHANNLTPAEHKELLDLNDLEEEKQIEYLEALVELSQIRGVSVDHVMRQLGVEKMKIDVNG